MSCVSPQLPNYAGGFVTRDARSQDPALHQGLVALWAPLMGPTGKTLYNGSAHGGAHHGVVNNGTWSATELVFDGTSSWVDIEGVSTGHRWTVFARVTPTSTRIRFVDFESDGMYFFSRYNHTLAITEASATRFSSLAVTADEINHIGLTTLMPGSSYRLFVDGDFEDVATTNTVSLGGQAALGAHYSGGSVYGSWRCQLFAIWDRVLMDQEFLQLSADPASLFSTRHAGLASAGAVSAAKATIVGGGLAV